MKRTRSLTIAIFLFVTGGFCTQAKGQLTDFYTSPGFTNLVNTLSANQMWAAAMKRYTGSYSTTSTRSGSTRASVPSTVDVVPAYRRYPAVQFKSTGTRLKVGEYVEALGGSVSEKAEIKKAILDVFGRYETEAAAKGHPNDWALAYVSTAGLNALIYNGSTEKLLIPFEQNIGLRDLVAEQATNNRTFDGVTDRSKQEMYELLLIMGAFTYHVYEKAVRENNVDNIKNCKLAAAQNLKYLRVKM